MNKLASKYLNLCSEFDIEPFPVDQFVDEDWPDVIGQHLSMLQEFCQKVEELLSEGD